MNYRLFITLVISVFGSGLIDGQKADGILSEPGITFRIPGHMDYVADEVIVKFRDEIKISADMLEKKTAPSGSLNAVLTEINLTKAEKLFPLEKVSRSKRTVRTPLGSDMVIPDLHNIYRLKLGSDQKGSPANIPDVIRALQQLPEIEYAEPNYIYSIGDFRPESQEFSQDEAVKWISSNSSRGSKGYSPNDPLFPEQWGIPAIRADEVWVSHTGDTNSVIAILDTGVDWLHPDLADNIWINRNELAGNGQDNDGNGFVDDIRGWDFINNDNNPTDDNSHGTHCAGIAAAVGNNGIGIAGVNWKAKIMPVKVFQSSGRGDAATISQGITYASKNGATVISMSFGSYAKSLTMEQALVNAYSSSVLVAAAGNDGLCIGPGICPDQRNGQPMFPASLSFVLGVEAPPRPPSGFTNYDSDGPVFSRYEEQYNYELSAPGVGILSTIPGGNYRSYSGTSMAAPIVSGAVSLYRELKSGESQELMFGDLINSSEVYIDIEKALTIIREPRINFISYEIIDTLGGDRDGRVDAGETIEIVFTVRNTWGLADDVMVAIELDEFEDQSVAIIQVPESTIGSISAYASRKNIVPLRVKVSEDVVNGRDIVFKAKAWYGAHLGELVMEIILNVENGEELSGVMDSTLVLTSDKLWLVNSSFKVGENGILLIDPGTNLILNKPLVNLGLIKGNGLKDARINIRGPESIVGSGKTIINEAYISDIRKPFYGYSYQAVYSFSNTIFNGLSLDDPLFNVLDTVKLDNCKIINSELLALAMNIAGGCFVTRCSFDNIVFSHQTPQPIVINSNFSRLRGNQYWVNSAFIDLRPGVSQLLNNNFISSVNSSIVTTIDGTSISFPYNYWGSLKKEIIGRRIQDFWDYALLSELVYEPKLNSPSSLNHGCVWKVLINGFDAQDESVDPVGVGVQKFEVFFNRPMDISYMPQVSFGVRYPYIQHSVNESGSWSADSTMYTVFKTINLTTGDGINTIRVASARDTEGWEIPVEDLRFNFLISAASAASSEFQAIPGLGKVDLEWNNTDLEDGLGYNMYRMEHLNDTTLNVPELINKQLIIDTIFVDYDVVPNKRYYYFYKILRTNLIETDSSKVVSTVPFTASKGDANGDLSVNVSDILSVVSYILMNNPQPFIFEAADMNSDGVINVLDVTAIVHKILYPGKSESGGFTGFSANLFVRNDTLFAETPVAIGGIQFTVRNTVVTNYEVLPALHSFERVILSNADSLFILAYSMNGKTFGPGTVPLIKFLNKPLGVEGIVLSTAEGKTIKSTFKGFDYSTHLLQIRDVMTNSLKVTPNPFKNEATITLSLPVTMDRVVLSIYNSSGTKVEEIVLRGLHTGYNEYTYRSSLRAGFYILKMTGFANGRFLTESSVKLIVN